MTVFIGIVVVVALVIALALWTAHRSYKPGSGHDLSGGARQTKMQAQEKGTKWSAGM